MRHFINNGTFVNNVTLINLWMNLTNLLTRRASGPDLLSRDSTIRHVVTRLTERWEHSSPRCDLQTGSKPGYEAPLCAEVSPLVFKEVLLSVSRWVSPPCICLSYASLCLLMTPTVLYRAVCTRPGHNGH